MIGHHHDMGGRAAIRATTPATDLRRRAEERHWRMPTVAETQRVGNHILTRLLCAISAMLMAVAILALAHWMGW